MKLFSNHNLLFIFLVFSVISCDDLSEINENPNGVDPNTVHPNLLMATVLTESSKKVVDLGFGNIAGVMQHTQKDAWFSGHNDYDWSNQSWGGEYGILRNIDHMQKRSEALDLEFHQAISLIMKSFMFGLITDLWGPAPYGNALKGDQGSEENLLPAFDQQSTIYNGIINDLQTSSAMLSQPANQYRDIVGDVDVIYDGNPAAWQRFANSLQLRYYMRISEKDPSAQAGFEGVAANLNSLILDPSQDATLSYVGNSSSDSWPSNAVTDISGSNYRRIKMCATLVDKLQSLGDPRLAVWAEPIDVKLVIDEMAPAMTDEVVDGSRRLSPDVVEGVIIDTDPEYVGIPPSVSSLPSAYNLNPTPGQTSFNPHVSYLNAIYQEASHPLLLARIISAAEVRFLLAEAALKGWSVGGSAEEHYNEAIKASLTTWGVEDSYDTYIATPGVAFDGTLQQIIEQKWIASWSAAAEAWFDFRRTGFPQLEAGPAAKRGVLPVRFYYMQNELNINTNNALQALGLLEETSFSQADGKNSAWSKPWIIQGTGKPW